MTYSIITPFTFVVLMLIIVFVLIDAFTIWMFTGRYGVSLWRSLTGSFWANIITSVMCIFVGFNNQNKENLIWFAVAAAVCIIFKWLFYIPYYRRNEVTSLRLFIVSCFSNIPVFAVLAFLFFYKTGILMEYFDFSFFVKK